MTVTIGEMINFPVYLVALHPDHKALMLKSRSPEFMVFPLFDDSEIAKRFAISQGADWGAIGTISSAAMLLRWVEPASRCDWVWWNPEQRDGKWTFESPTPMQDFLERLRHQADSEGSAELN